MKTLHKFLIESNLIERIKGYTQQELEEAERFLALEKLSVSAIEKFVSVIQPNAVLRDKPGLNVIVGNYHPPRGNPRIKLIFSALLEQINDGEIGAFQAHVAYENLHPFTDGNGRSGRMIWLWQTKKAPLGFLHTFYYQALRG